MAKRQQTVTLQLRMRPGTKGTLEAAAAIARRRLQAETPGARLGVGPWLLSLGVREAQRMGLTHLEAGPGATTAAPPETP